MGDFDGKVILVTGGSRGIGAAITRQLAGGGGEVAIHYSHHSRRAEALADELGPARCHLVQADFSDPASALDAWRAALEWRGRIDVLVNNAGGAPPAETATVSPRFNEKVIALNLLAPLTFAQAVHPVMSAQDSGGVIINISSVSSIRPTPAGAAYGAAKAGLDSLTQTLAHEWGPAIRVLSVMVGLLRTEQAHLYYGDEAGIEAVGRTLALGRLGDPAEIADVVLFCASPLASFMSGASVPVHGGGEVPSYLLATTGEVAQYRPGPKP